MAARLKPWRVPDRFWAEVEPLIPKVERRFRYPGRRRHDDRACLEGILYVLRYAVPWAELPPVEGWPSVGLLRVGRSPSRGRLHDDAVQ